MTLFDTNVVSAFLDSDARKRRPQLCALVEGALGAGTAAISHFTHFELRRGVLDLVQRGQGRRRLVALTKFIAGVEVLGLDHLGGVGWSVAAEHWAKLHAHKPAINLTDGDLLIATTAAFHGHAFATSEGRLVENLRRIDFPGELIIVPLT